MLTKLLILTGLIQAAFAVTENNIPKLDPKVDPQKTWNCTNYSDVCEIKFIVSPFMSMTYYDFERMQKLVGCRAHFTDEGILNVLRKTTSKICEDVSGNGLQEPITTDGEFRSLITINGQMPGPTIIARVNQRLVITVYNELPNIEGISIHWHGMHQRGSTQMDGVAYISHNPILPYQQYTYEFQAFPAGTHWYHAHSGAHRTDGLYGALIVKDDRDDIPGVTDLPDQHTLLLMDWQKEPSIDLFYQTTSSLGFFTDIYEEYKSARAPDNTLISPFPFWSGIINDKGRHYNEEGVHNNADLNVFNVQAGIQYRFRLIGAQALYAYKFSIQDHLLTVVATDGSPIDSITNVTHVIVNTGERYDVIVYADKDIGNYWILAQTLETEGGDGAFYNPINTHKAEAVLHYDGAPAYREDMTLANSSSSWNCSQMECHFVNCHFRPVSSSNIRCTNVDNFRDSVGRNAEAAINDVSDTRFYNFGFDGEKSTEGSSVDGINFRFPSVLPYESGFSQQVCTGRGCDHSRTDHCACTHVIDITNVRSRGVIQLVITNYPKVNKLDETAESAHPVHLHGHGFYVVKIGYPVYNEVGEYDSPNPDINCTVGETGSPCERFITVREENAQKYIQTVQWVNGQPNFNTEGLFLKDTVMVPYGGYTVIRFVADNPGWWLLHCHIEIHQLEGMAAVVREEGPSNMGTKTAEASCLLIGALVIMMLLQPV